MLFKLGIVAVNDRSVENNTASFLESNIVKHLKI